MYAQNTKKWVKQGKKLVFLYFLLVFVQTFLVENVYICTQPFWKEYKLF